MNQVFIYIIIILAGLTVGSFLNVLVLRFDQFSTILSTRSHCPHCKKQIRWYDLIPFFSFVFLKAKCRDCQKPISFQYPIVEGITAIVFALIYWKFGLSWEALLLALSSSLLIVIAAYDVLKNEVPDSLSFTAIILSIGFVLLHLWATANFSWLGLLPYVWAILAGGGFLGIIVAVSKEKWMGAGDILLGVIMGLLAGWPAVLLAMFAAFVIGSIAGLILMGLKQKTLKDAVPFGPFLVLGTFTAVFWGEKIINWYLGVF